MRGRQATFWHPWARPALLALAVLGAPLLLPDIARGACGNHVRLTGQQPPARTELPPAEHEPFAPWPAPRPCPGPGCSRAPAPLPAPASAPAPAVEQWLAFSAPPPLVPPGAGARLTNRDLAHPVRGPSPPERPPR